MIVIWQDFCWTNHYLFFFSFTDCFILADSSSTLYLARLITELESYNIRPT